MHAAASTCVVPEFFKNSSSSISPGCVGGRWVGSRCRGLRVVGMVVFAAYSRCSRLRELISVAPQSGFIDEVHREMNPDGRAPVGAAGTLSRACWRVAYREPAGCFAAGVRAGDDWRPGRGLPVRRLAELEHRHPPAADRHSRRERLLNAPNQGKSVKSEQRARFRTSYGRFSTGFSTDRVRNCPADGSRDLNNRQ